MTITRSDIQQAAEDSGMTEMAALTAMQSAAVTTGDMATLEILCAIKGEILGL